jgi:hypothetical protein
MPPSGYSSQQADALGAFLRSCSFDLEREAIEFGFTYSERLEKEIADISSYLESGAQLTLAQKAVLQLTSDFYSGVKRFSPVSPDEFRAAVGEALKEVTRGVLAIHIDDKALLRARIRPVAAE